MSLLKRCFFVIGLTVLLMLVSACAKSVNPSEVLQISQFAAVRTAYNLWYEDPMEMNTLNYLKGEILPFGTEIEFVKVTDKEIIFRTAADKKQFRIHFTDQYRFQSVQDYMKRLFTTAPAMELTLGVRPVTIEKIKRGIVEKGMTRQEVSLAFGPPCAFKTPSEAANTWIYWTDFIVSKRIIFSNEKVLEILYL